MMAIFNLRRVFLPIAVGIPSICNVKKESVLVPLSAFIISRFRPEDGLKRRPVCRVGRLATLLIASMLAIGSTPELGDAGLWDDVKEWYVSFELGEVDEANIPQTPVEYVGKVGLTFQGQIELAFDEDTPGIGMVFWMNFSPEGTLLITDGTVAQALEFSRTDGQYIRSFGRRGNGPGEYGSPRAMAVDPQGRVYLLDIPLGQILRYDRRGNYLDRTQLLSSNRILIGHSGEVFLVKTNPMKILEVQRVDPETWEVLYRTPVSTDKQRFISSRMNGYVQMCYSATRHRLYYLGPNDYLIKEINADTGAIIRQFGQSPEGFIPLPKRYDSLWRGSITDMNELEMTSVKSMTLIDERYLFVSYSHRTLKVKKGVSPLRWVLYDLTFLDRIESYNFDETAIEHLESFTNIIPWNSVAAWQDHLYIWRSPSEKRAETSNGTVEIYALSFDST